MKSRKIERKKKRREIKKDFFDWKNGIIFKVKREWVKRYIIRGGWYGWGGKKRERNEREG